MARTAGRWSTSSRAGVPAGPRARSNCRPTRWLPASPGWAPPPEFLKVSFVYLGDGLEVVSQEADGAWLERAEQRVLELVDGIRSEQFRTTPSDACRSCDFLTLCEAGQAHLGAEQ